MFRDTATVALQDATCESLDFEFVSVCCMFRKLLLLPNFVLFPSVQTQLGSCVLDPKKLGDFVISFSALHAW